ncbi:hypothetical protein ACLMAL_36805 [Nocardia sp. CWNU-33]|uniref:hypothetical protein n=1 Tax=Nocardia sp. CWNU-33 TaxID=3392117 RepID=UPI00398F33AF
MWEVSSRLAVRDLICPFRDDRTDTIAAQQNSILAEDYPGLYEFGEAPEWARSAGMVVLFFDELEYSAFVRAVEHDEFARAVFAYQ